MILTGLVQAISNDDFSACMIELEEQGILDSEDYTDKTKFINDISKFDNMHAEILALLKEKLTGAETETAVTKVVKVKIPGRPALKDFVRMQNSQGFWRADKVFATTVDLLTEGGSFASFPGRDSLIVEVRKQAKLNADECVCTILALFFLREAYEEMEGEWTLIARKARDWLKVQGVAEADSLIKLIKIRVK